MNIKRFRTSIHCVIWEAVWFLEPQADLCYFKGHGKVPDVLFHNELYSLNNRDKVYFRVRVLENYNAWVL